ncbi:MAG: aminotransferase class V-fold PLP-dependent enzyme [Planctomycetes bacterium]|nr:aminotransferase class V-fold PLP-dependent enzyme [Planctomycetota bacterium]
MTKPIDPHAWRPRFPISEKSTYLVNHSLGAMPKAVHAKLEAFATQWETRGVRSWAEGWWTAPLDVGNLLGKLMNAPENSVVMHQNVSVIQSIVGSAFDFAGKRNKVVYSDANFPTNMYVWEGFKRFGARISVVKSEGMEVPTERMIAAIDEETLIVPISHVCFKTSYLQDAKAICARAREVGALVLLDTYQSLGTVPVDVQDLGVDMVCGGSVKWLCGGPGAGYLYVRPDLQDQLNPRVTGWAAHAAPFAFEQGEQRYAHGIARYLHGSPAVASLVQASAGYEAVLEAGVHAIRDHSLRLTGTLEQDLVDRGFEINSPADPARRGGTLTVGLKDDEDGPAFVKALEAREILVDHRPEAGIRVSPHFYTLPEELSVFAETLSELRESRKWQDYVSMTASY